jgi:cell division protein FtsB
VVVLDSQELTSELAAIEEAAIKRQKELEKLRSKQAKEQAKLNRLKQISLMLIQKEARFDLKQNPISCCLARQTDR